MTHDTERDAGAGDSVTQSSSSASSSEAAAAHHATGRLPALIVGAIGVVYGDIGTSPLYALRESLAHSVKADLLSEETVIGAISPAYIRSPLHCHGKVRAFPDAG